jgi:RNA polymerase sigma-70 factor (ECF subfamily)
VTAKLHKFEKKCQKTRPSSVEYGFFEENHCKAVTLREPLTGLYVVRSFRLASQSDSSETDRLLDLLDRGDKSALEHLLACHRDYVKRVVELRMDDAIRARVDPSDVVQETQMMVMNRIDDYLQQRSTSFRVWLRRETMEKLTDVRRQHLAQKRSVKRDLRLSEASSLSIAQQLLAASPSRLLQRKELATQVRDAIESLSEIDREVIMLRHIEGLTNVEVAEVLNIDTAAVRQRHGRALRRLIQQLAENGVSGGQ